MQNSEFIATSIVSQIITLILAFIGGWALSIPFWESLRFEPMHFLDGALAGLAMVSFSAFFLRLPGPLSRGYMRGVENIADGMKGLKLHQAYVILPSSFAEECLIRGVLQTWLVGWIGAAPAVVTASFMFAAIFPINLPFFLYTAVAGCLFGVMYLWTDNLFTSIIAKVVYDLISITWIVYSHNQQSDCEPQ